MPRAAYGEKLLPAISRALYDRLDEAGEALVEASEHSGLLDADVELYPWAVAEAPAVIDKPAFLLLLIDRFCEGRAGVGYSAIPKFASIEALGAELKSPLHKRIFAAFGSANDKLARLLFDGRIPDWFGKEISRFADKDSVDLFAPCQKNRFRCVSTIHLKSRPPQADDIGQLRICVDWIERHYTPNFPGHTAPVLIAEKNPRELPADFVDAVNRFNRETKGGVCEALRLIEFEVVGDDSIHYAERAIR